VDSNQVVQLYHDPRHALNQVVFVDARNDDHYQAGHIPGAFQLDYYRPAEYLPVLMPIAQTAEQIVIYCNGGTCEDSELAAGLLAQAVPKEKLLVYAGGFAEWLTNGLPVEVGARLSGRFKTNTPAL
jgi:rhodanese-related sulfurtransferase